MLSIMEEMRQLSINPSQIISVEVFIGVKHPNIMYKAERHFLGFRIRKKGFYFKFGDLSISPEKLTKTAYIEDKTVYCKPHLQINYLPNKSKTRFFETSDDLWKFYKQNFTGWVEVPL